MPRKAKKTVKSPLLFLEQPSCGSRLRNVPEVRAALNPKEFFTEEPSGSSSALQTWVRPQFDRSALAAPPARRGRRRCHSAASILDGCTQPARKTSVCKFPTLSFQTRPRDRQAKSSKKTTQRAAEVGNKAKKTTNYSDAPERPSNSTREKRHEAQTSSSAVSDQNGNEANSCRTPADAPSTPPSCIAPPPDVDTPEVLQEERRSPMHASKRLLLEQPLTPPCSPPPHTLVADTPERDYGLKVTWRRRKAEMSSLRERGYLSECDTLIQKT